jgi:hypothetical protein
MLYRTRRRFVEGNLEGALSEEPRPWNARKLSKNEERGSAAGGHGVFEGPCRTRAACDVYRFEYSSGSVKASR